MSILTIEGFGVVQTRVQAEDIELVRRWRTDPAVNRYMFYRGEITPEQQQRWFESIDNDENYYFIVHYEGRKIGLNSIKNIDWTTRSGEGGLFIVPDEYKNSLTAFRIAIPPLIWLFEHRDLACVHAKIQRENKRAIRYNRALGHTFDPEIEGSDVVTSRFTKEAFAARKPFFERVFEGEVSCRVTGGGPTERIPKSAGGTSTEVMMQGATTFTHLRGRL